MRGSGGRSARVPPCSRLAEKEGTVRGDRAEIARLVELLPKVEVALLVRVRVRVGDDVELAERRRALVPAGESWCWW